MYEAMQGGDWMGSLRSFVLEYSNSYVLTSLIALPIVVTFLMWMLGEFRKAIFGDVVGGRRVVAKAKNADEVDSDGLDRDVSAWRAGDESSGWRVQEAVGQRGARVVLPPGANVSHG